MSEFENEMSLTDIKNAEGLIETEKIIKSVRCDTGCDFTLPDYLGDIKKLLSVSCDVIPSGKFDGGGEASFCGIAVYKVLYTDSDNTLTHAEFTSDYEVNVKTDDTYIDSCAVTEVASMSVRPQGPRKLCAKASLISDVYVSCEASVPTLSEDESIEKDTADIKVHSAEYLTSGEREYAEEAARLEGVSADDVEVLMSGADVRIDKVSLEDDGIHLAGAIEAYALLKIGEDATARVEKDLSFEEIIECDGGDIIASPLARGYVTSNTVSINSDNADSGEDGASVVFSITAEYDVYTDKNTEMSIIKDAYMPGTMSEASYAAFSYSTLEDAVRESRNMTYEVPRAELPCDGITEILHTEVTVKQQDISVNDGVIAVKGELCFNTVVKTADDDGYCSIKTSHPFEVIIPLQSQLESARLGHFYLKPCSVSSSVDAAKLYLKCTLSVCAAVVTENGKTVVSELRKTGECDSSHGVITVYYPDENDTLWSVGKKYSQSLAKLAQNNALSESVFSESSTRDSLLGVETLIITE